jgi:hypothetical protein
MAGHPLVSSRVLLCARGSGAAAKADFLQTSIDCLPPVALSFLIKGQVKSWVRHNNVGGQTVREVMREKPRSVRADTSLHELVRWNIRSG